MAKCVASVLSCDRVLCLPEVKAVRRVEDCSIRVRN